MAWNMLLNKNKIKFTKISRRGKYMKKVIITLFLVLCMAGAVWATPVMFTPDVSGSSVTVIDNAKWGNMKGTLALAASPFTLADGITQTINFFTLTASGIAFNKNYSVEAKLAFSAPLIESEGDGSGKFTTIFGLLSGGTLTWDPATIPNIFTLADGNQIKIDFENGSTIGFGNTATVHAYITNLGGATAVPEPITILLLGLGLVGIAGIRRKIKK